MPLPAFHYIKHGRAYGPVTINDLLRMVAEGLLGDDDLVRAEGNTRWRPALEVVESMRAGQVVSVPPPPRVSGRPGGVNNTVFTQAPPAGAGQPVRARGRRLKKCVHCAARTDADARICHKCGSDLSLPARNCGCCGNKSPANAKFCGTCGNAL